MDRRDFLKKSALTGAAVALGSRIPILSSALADSSSDPLTAGCLWGVHCEPRTQTATAYTAIQNLEQKVGRRFAVDRQYHRFDTVLPTTYERWTKQHGRTPYVSWNSFSSSGAAVSWARIAQGYHDVFIRQQAASIKQWGRHMYFTFNHEPENDAGSCGTAAAYRQAFTHIIDVFNNQGVSNVTWVVTLMAPTFRGNNGGPHNWLPASYDMIGCDGYNRWPRILQPAWRSFAEVFSAAHTKSVELGKRLFVGEYGCVEQVTTAYPDGDPQAKADWFRGAARATQRWGNVVALSYSHAGAMFGGKLMPYWADSSSPSLNAFKTVGLSSYFN